MNPGKYVIFALDGERFGLPVEGVQQILNASPITRLPKSSSEILGLLDLRGETIPVIDARQILGMPEGSHACFVVVVVGEFRAALTVDRVDRIDEFAEAEIEETGDWGSRDLKTFVGRKNGTLTILLTPDVLIPKDALLTEENIAA